MSDELPEGVPPEFYTWSKKKQEEFMFNRVGKLTSLTPTTIGTAKDKILEHQNDKRSGWIRKLVKSQQGK
jgi:hypothetical protein